MNEQTAQRLQAAQIRPGDHVRVVGLGAVWMVVQEVQDTSDPSLVTLQAPSGALLRVGRQAISEIQTAGERRWLTRR